MLLGLLLSLCTASAASAGSGEASVRDSAPTTTYLYGEEVVTIPDPAAISYVEAGACGRIENHTAYLGHDVGGDPNPGVQVESLEDCCELCNASPLCRFVSLNGHTCYLKTSDAGRTTKGHAGVVSASRTALVPPAPPPAPTYNGSLPNIVFLIVESTDGRTYHEDSDAYIPNIRSLQARGAYFKNFYTNSPVCAASRSSVWSGRHVHRIPHTNQGIKVNGAWNNAEGNDPTFSKGWGDALEILGTERNYTSNRVNQLTGKGCNQCAFGKEDWTVGSHALWNWLQCWTMYTPLPFNLTDHMGSGRLVAGGGGWSEQPHGGECRSDGVISPHNQTHKEDWNAAKLNTAWLRDKTSTGATQAQPFYVYQGMNIVHPPYVTTQHWYDKIADNLTVPEWQPLSEMHPCALQSSMLKGCIPDAEGAEDFYSLERRRNVRRVYLAMIAEFDAMVGEYITAVADAGLTSRTIFVVTSDHGDMDMEQQQFYKMVPYEASTRVPLVIAGPNIVHATYMQATSLVDLYPTLLDFAKADRFDDHDIDGHSLVPLLDGSAGAVDTQRPQWALSQGHMADNAISWFVLREGDMKLIVYGTGEQNDPQLFNITRDPMEMEDLASTRRDTVATMTATLKTAIDFPAVALDVADYNQKMFRWYMSGGYKSTAGGNQNLNCTSWQAAVVSGSGGGPDADCPGGGLPGGPSGEDWGHDGAWGTTAAGLKALLEWAEAPPKVSACRPFDWKPSGGGDS